MSVRELVGEIFAEVRTTELSPQRAAFLETRLSSLLHPIAAELREREVDFNLRYLECLREHKAANRAKVVAQTSEQWKRRQEARDLEKVSVELIRSLRHLGRIQAEEMRLSR